MPNFMGSPNAELVKCTNSKCGVNDPDKQLAPTIRVVRKYLVVKPNEFDKYYRAKVVDITLYCCHCNQPLAKGAMPTDYSEVIGMEELKP